MLMVTQFMQDDQGRRFADVLNDTRIDFKKILEFFEDPDRQRRMIESEVHHDRPPLAGVVREFEAWTDVKAFFEGYDAHTTIRFRQAVGVAVKIAMAKHGWKTTGRKGSLGTRAKVSAHTKMPGAYRNDSGLSLWFTRTERYTT